VQHHAAELPPSYIQSTLAYEYSAMAKQGKYKLGRGEQAQAKAFLPWY